jgi:hypothetical protein
MTANPVTVAISAVSIVVCLWGDRVLAPRLQVNRHTETANSVTVAISAASIVVCLQGDRVLAPRLAKNCR